MSKKLLIAVDLQKDFIDGALGTPQAQQILPAVRGRKGKALSLPAIRTDRIIPKRRRGATFPWLTVCAAAKAG